MKILILEANPHKDLSFNEEIQGLKNVIRRSRDRQEFKIEDALAVRSTDLQKLILDFEPNIIHSTQQSGWHYYPFKLKRIKSSWCLIY